MKINHMRDSSHPLFDDFNAAELLIVGFCIGVLLWLVAGRI